MRPYCFIFILYYEPAVLPSHPTLGTQTQPRPPFPRSWSPGLWRRRCPPEGRWPEGTSRWEDRAWWHYQTWAEIWRDTGPGLTPYRLEIKIVFCEIFMSTYQNQFRLQFMERDGKDIVNIFFECLVYNQYLRLAEIIVIYHIIINHICII